MHSLVPHVLSLTGLRMALQPMSLLAIMQQVIKLLCLVELIMLLVCAALADAHRRHIPIIITLLIAMLALPYGLASGWSFGVEIAGHVFSAVVLGAAMLTGFRFGMVSGDELKLMSALGLWLSPSAAIGALLITAITGGLLASAMHRQHRRRLSQPGVPYAVGIAAAGIVHFAAPLAQLLS